MDIVLKTYLDTGMKSTLSTQEACTEALRQSISQANGNIEDLTSSLNYLVMNQADTNAITTFMNVIIETNIEQKSLMGILVESLKHLVMHNAYNTNDVIIFLEATLQTDIGQKALVDSITSEAEFVKYLEYESIRDIVTRYLKDNEHLQELAQSMLISEIIVDSAVLMALCDLRGKKGQEFLKPQRLKRRGINDFLKFMRLSPNEFFPDVANLVVEDCLAFNPQYEAGPWISEFFSEIIGYYGRPALSWMSEQIVDKKEIPEFWENALFVLSDISSRQERVSLKLTSEQSNWMHRCKMKRMREKLESENRNILSEIYYHSRYSTSGRVGDVTIQFQQPMTWLTDFSLDFPGHEYRAIWSWLMSEAAEAAIYSWFHQSCMDLVDDYTSPEDSITGALCAYLKSHASEYKELLDTAWRIGHPKEKLQLNIDWVECRIGRDVGGADLALVLSANAGGIYARSSFSAFQCKKLKGGSLSFSNKELIQKEQIQKFTHSAYYMLYPCESNDSNARGPIVISARTMSGMLKARVTKTVDRHVLLSTGRALEEYFVADLLPGWSGDERWETPEEIREVVEAALSPKYILNMTVSVIPREGNNDYRR
jgi:hypothetical protein